MYYHFEDFTEEHYANLLKLVTTNFKFISFNDYLATGRNVLWRHDIDMSFQRACQWAKSEAAVGISAVELEDHNNESFYGVS